MRTVPRCQHHTRARHFRAWFSISRGSQARSKLDKESALHRATNIVGRAFQALKERTILIRERRAAVLRAWTCEEAWAEEFEVAIAHRVLLVWRHVASKAKLQALQLHVTSLQDNGSDVQQQLRSLQTQHEHLRSNTALEAETWKLRQMQIATTLLGKIFRQELAAAFLSFVHACQRARLEAREHTIKMRVVQRMRQTPLIAALQGWRQQATAQKELVAKARRVVLRLRNCTLVAGFERWLEKTREERQMRNKARKVMMRLLKAGLVLAFELWREHGGELRRQREILEKVAVRMRNGSVCKAFARWNENAREMRRQRSVMQRVAQRMMKAGIVLAFQQWCTSVKEEKDLKAKALKVVLRMWNSALVLAFERWREHITEEKGMRQKANKVVLRMWNSALVLAFERWCEHIAEEKGMRQKANKVIMRFTKAGMVRGFERWRDHVAEEKVMRNKALKVVQRMMNSAVAMAFEVWLHHVVHDRELKVTAVKVVKRWLNQTLSHAVDLWLHFVSVQKVQRQESASQLHISNLEGQLAVVKLDLESRQEQVISKIFPSQVSSFPERTHMHAHVLTTHIAAATSTGELG